MSGNIPLFSAPLKHTLVPARASVQKTPTLEMIMAGEEAALNARLLDAAHHEKHGEAPNISSVPGMVWDAMFHVATAPEATGTMAGLVLKETTHIFTSAQLAEHDAMVTADLRRDIGSLVRTIHSLNPRVLKANPLGFDRALSKFTIEELTK